MSPGMAVSPCPDDRFATRSGGRRAAGNHVDIPEFPFSMPSFSTHLTRLLQGLFTLLLTLFGLLLVTFALRAVAGRPRAADRRRPCQSVDLRPFVISWVSTNRCRSSSGTTRSTCPMAILASPAPPASRCSMTCWRSFRQTLELATPALIVGAVPGIVAGVLCARYAGSPWIWRCAPLPCWATPVPIFLARPADAGPCFTPGCRGAGPGRLDDIYQYTVEPRSGFALIDTGSPAIWRRLKCHRPSGAAGAGAWPITAGQHHPPDPLRLPSEMNKEYIRWRGPKGLV